MNDSRPNALIITTAGINCDRELAHAFSLAGAKPKFVHLNALLDDPSIVDSFQLIGLPGGFSYGDAIAAGRITAQLMRQRLYEAIGRAIDRGVPMIAPCNGFQIAAQMGLLPGPATGEARPSTPPRPTVALAQNAGGRFIDNWCRVMVPANTRCVWTQGLSVPERTSMLPIAHGEGRFVADDSAMIDQLDESGCVAVRYASDDNPNGSMGDVAGICDSTGLIFGLMPHPERYTSWQHHPFWTRLDDDEMSGEPFGLQMFRNAVAHVTSVHA